jgi:hypothetical protein
VNEDITKQTTRLAIQLVGVVVLAVVSVKVQRAAAKPDFGRIFMMKRAWAFKRFADGQVRFWEGIAGSAANRYNALKP